jgi:hypothetical protein
MASVDVASFFGGTTITLEGLAVELSHAVVWTGTGYWKLIYTGW